MSYNRKQFDKKKLKKLAKECAGWCGGSYYSERKGRYIRFWKSRRKNSFWATEKRYGRRIYRRRANKVDYKLAKKAYDLWWNVW